MNWRLTAVICFFGGSFKARRFLKGQIRSAKNKKFFESVKIELTNILISAHKGLWRNYFLGHWESGEHNDKPHNFIFLKNILNI